MCIKWHAKCQTDLPYVCVLLAVRKETVLWILLAVQKENCVLGDVIYHVVCRLYTNLNATLATIPM